MSNGNPFKNDYLFPRVQKQNALQEQIQALEQFRMMMNEEDQRAFDDLIHRAEKHLSISYLAPGQTPFEQLLLTMMLELHKETEKLKDEVQWKLLA